MLRPIDLTRIREELRRMQRLDEESGVPLLGDHFQRILEDGWVARNPEIYHLYEADGRLRGYAGLIPIHPETYRSFIEGERFPFRDTRADDILTVAEYDRARREGVWIWIESFTAADAAARPELGEYVYAYLTEMNLKGLVVATSSPVGENDCR